MTSGLSSWTQVQLVAALLFCRFPALITPCSECRNEYVGLPQRRCGAAVESGADAVWSGDVEMRGVISFLSGERGNGCGKCGVTNSEWFGSGFFLLGF